MRFSLKDMFWSVTLASLGMSCIVGFLSIPFRDLAALMLWPSAAFFGTSLGVLLRRGKLGFWIGMILGFILTAASLAVLVMALIVD